MNRLLLAFALVFVASFPARAALPPPEDLGGSMVAATSDGKAVAFPTLWIDVEAHVVGDLALVTTTQSFENPSDQPVSATYSFPLDELAAVHAMRMEVGDEVVRATIRKVEDAKEEFERARSEGRAASLVVQHRPNVFTQDVANVMPGLPIVVTISHVQPARRVGGWYELVIPLVVGPRFQPPGAPQHPSQAAGTPFSAAELQALPAQLPAAGLHAPSSAVQRERVAVEVHLAPGLKLLDVASKTHALGVERQAGSEARVTLAAGAVPDDRDLVLRWRVAGESAQVAGRVERLASGERHATLLIEPPAHPAEESIAARELVFLLDCSGSMGGVPIETSRALVAEALRAARPRDSFRIIRFSDSATEYAAKPIPVTPASVEAAVTHVNGLSSEGGTMMTAGIHQALAVPATEGVVRLVFFLTDGYIGNEHDILKQLHSEIGDARLFAVGVGAGVNRFLLSELGRIGRGFTRYVDPTREHPADVVAELVARVDAPLLTDISIDWGATRVEQPLPAQVPDLFAGQSLRVLARLDGPPSSDVVVRGVVAGERVAIPVKLVEEDAPEGGAPVALSWGRARIESLMAELSLPLDLREGGQPDDLVKARIVELGLAHALVTQWTSFVAVSEQIVNPDGGAPTTPVAVSQVAGTTAAAYGLSVSPPRARSVFGTPEASPLTAAGVLAAAVAALLILRRWS